MKLISYRTQGPAIHVGVVREATVVQVDAVVQRLELGPRETAVLAEHGASGETASMLKLLLAGPPGIEQVRKALEPGDLPCIALDAAEMLAPIPRPGKIFGVGRNFGAHAQETGTAAPEQPRIFVKVATGVRPSGARIPIPRPVLNPDFEIELAVVIGRFAQAVDEAEALDYVAGYTIINDLSARELQFDVSPPQTSFAKSFDGAAPMGPWLVTADEIPDPQTLGMHCMINGETVQADTTARMLFPVRRLLAHLSRYATLEPGDVIATGTPSGVGAFRKPPVWLKAGDHVAMTIDRIGTLEHWIG